MAARGVASRRAVQRVTSRALLLRVVPVGDADLLLTLFTEARGVLTAAARGARRSAKRFGALEPIHELFVDVEVREGGEIGRLVEARIDRVRSRVAGSLDRIEVAGRLLRWIRRACPPGVPEPAVFSAAERALEVLDAEGAVRCEGALAAFGLGLLEALGWGLDLEACVACGRACPLSSSASIDPTRGGLVCRACGGARRILAPRVRVALLAVHGEGVPLADEDAAVAIDLVEAALEAHVAPGRAASGDQDAGAR